MLTNTETGMEWIATMAGWVYFLVMMVLLGCAVAMFVQRPASARLLHVTDVSAMVFAAVNLIEFGVMVWTLWVMENTYLPGSEWRLWHEATFWIRTGFPLVLSQLLWFAKIRRRPLLIVAIILASLLPGVYLLVQYYFQYLRYRVG